MTTRPITTTLEAASERAAIYFIGNDNDGVEITAKRTSPNHMTVTVRRRGGVQVRLFNEAESIAKFIFRLTPRVGWRSAILIGITIGATVLSGLKLFFP